MTSIRLLRGAFGHLALLTAASDFVTHAHAEHHIVIHIDGSPGVMKVADQLVCPGPAMAVGVNAFEPHSHSFGPGCPPGRFLAFYIRPDWVLRRHGLGLRLFRRTAVPLDDWLRRAVLELPDRHDADAGDLAEYEIERLIDHLVEAAEIFSPRHPSGARATSPTDHRVRKAIGLMGADVGSRIGLDEVARSVGLSRPHFFALFKEQMNLTPNVYWNTLRMEEACQQLQASDDSLTMVACSLGFTSQGNFTRFFRDHSGVTPTLYREAARATG